MKPENIDTKMLKVLLFISVCVFSVTFIIVSSVIVKYCKDNMTDLPEIFVKIKDFFNNI